MFASPCASYGMASSGEEMGSAGKIGELYAIGVEGGEEVVEGNM